MVRDSFLGSMWFINVHHSLSPVIKLGIRHPRKKEKSPRGGCSKGLQRRAGNKVWNASSETRWGMSESLTKQGVECLQRPSVCHTPTDPINHVCSLPGHQIPENYCTERSLRLPRCVHSVLGCAKHRYCSISLY